MKFNFSIKRKEVATVNRERATAYAMTPEMELYSAVATTLLSDVHYEKADARLTRIQDLIKVINPVFTAKLAIYAREQMNLRTVPLVLVTELASICRGDNLVSRTVTRVVQRPDEIMELLAYYQFANKRSGHKKLKSLSKQIQKGLAAAFCKFDEYQFAKYDRDTDIKLRDALFLVHPKPKDEVQHELFRKIANRELATPYTWETELSRVGQMTCGDENSHRQAVRETWEQLIDSQRMGYMATLRNLRNILEAGVSHAHINQLCSYLMNERAVQQSKQLPFRFLAAYRELKSVTSDGTGKIMTALEKALHISVANIAGFDDNTRVVIACDVSGSMQKSISGKSKVMLYDIGLLLGMILQSKCSRVISGFFGDSWKTVAMPAQQILANVDAFYEREGEVGYSTNGYKVLEDLIRRKHVADKVMMFTDMQLWDSKTGNQSEQNTLAYQWKEYRKMAPDAQLYLFDLAGYGQSPVRTRDNGVYLIAGWSDRIFELMDMMEQGHSAIAMIHDVTL